RRRPSTSTSGPWRLGFVTVTGPTPPSWPRSVRRSPRGCGSPTPGGSSVDRGPAARRSDGEVPAPPVAVGPQDAAGYRLDVHLVGPVVDAGRTSVAVHATQRGVVGEPGGAMSLNGAVDDIVEHAGPDDLDRADLHTGITAAVHRRRGVQREET